MAIAMESQVSDENCWFFFELEQNRIEQNMYFSFKTTIQLFSLVI